MIINPVTDVGKRLLAYLRQNPMTIGKFAKKVQLHPITIKKILEGQIRTRMDITFTLEKFLDQYERSEKESNG